MGMRAVTRTPQSGAELRTTSLIASNACICSLACSVASQGRAACSHTPYLQTFTWSAILSICTAITLHVIGLKVSERRRIF